MYNYLEWLNKDENGVYFFITLLLLGLIAFIVVNIFMFVYETIEKNKKVEELEKEINKMKARKEKCR